MTIVPLQSLNLCTNEFFVKCGVIKKSSEQKLFAHYLS